MPALLIWLVLMSTIRRDLNYVHVLNWMVSGYRWIKRLLPSQSKIVTDGAISHARVKLGVDVFRALFYKLVPCFLNSVVNFGNSTFTCISPIYYIYFLK